MEVTMFDDDVRLKIKEAPKTFQKPSELVHVEEELYTENDDDDFFPDDKAACFFCYNKPVSLKLLKAHLCGHLFDPKRKLDRKSFEDAFFLNWINNFSSMQGAYFVEENGRDDNSFFHKQCQICLKFSLDSDFARFCNPELESKYSLRAQKLHFINHSSFKPFKCSPCERNGQGHFWMPDDKNIILKHLVLCHHSLMISIAVLKELCFFRNLYELSEEDWETVIKPLLSHENLVIEFSSQNELLSQNWKGDNLLALKKLESQYYRSIRKFNLLIANYEFAMKQ